MTDPQIRDALRQIADALEIPTSALIDPQAACSHDPSVAAALNAAELLRLFERISDERKRRECIEFVRERTL
jgi:hypothetical protein